TTHHLPPTTYHLPASGHTACRPSHSGLTERNRMKIQDIMTRDPSSVTPESPARDAARIMKEEDVGIVPVVDDQSSRRLVGVVTDRDLAIRIVAEERDADTRVRDVMSGSQLATCAPDQDLDEVMQTMASEQVR